MATRTMTDLVVETTVGEDSDYELRPATEIAQEFNESDVTLLLAWQAGIMLAEALNKVQEGREQGLDTAEIEDTLTERDKSVIYGAYLLSETFQSTEE